jgi:adenylosuccinate lyase
LKDMSEVTDKISNKKLQELCDPINYLGSCREMVDDTLALSRVLG